MKKDKSAIGFISLVSVVFTSGIFVAPAMARNVLAVDIIPCGDTVPLGSAGAGSCGSNPAASDPLIEGTVRVNSNGNVRVNLVVCQG
jgi:hypothetical protein